MRSQLRIKPPYELVVKITTSSMLKFLLAVSVSIIKFTKLPIIEMEFKVLKHLYNFPSPNVRIIELEDEII